MDFNSTISSVTTTFEKPNVCDLSRRLAESTFLRGGMAIKAMLCLVCLPSAWFIVKKKGLRWLGNSSSKALFIFHVFWSVQVPVFFGISYAFDAIRLSIPQSDPCGYTISAPIGFAFRGPPGYGVTVQTMSVLAFAVERAISTIFPTYFEKRGSCWLGVFLATFFTTINTVWWTSRTIFMADFTDKFVLCTVWTSKTMDINLINVLIYFITEFLTVTIFIVTWFINRIRNQRLKASDKNISEKYQIGENRRVMGALAPCFFLHWVFSCAQYGSILIQKYIPEIGDWGSASATILIEIFAFQPYLYLISMAFILNCFLNRQKRLVVDSAIIMESHFNQINNHFEQHFERKVASRKQQQASSAKWCRFWTRITVVCQDQRSSEHTDCVITNQINSAE